MNVRPLIASGFFWFAAQTPALAEPSTMKTSMAWGLVLLCIVLGMMVTLQPIRREKDVKGRKD